MRQVFYVLAFLFSVFVFYRFASFVHYKKYMYEKTQYELTKKCQSLGGTVISARDMPPICVKELK